MSRRTRKKNKQPLFIGRTSSIGILFWPQILEKKEKLLKQGAVRHSKKKKKIEKDIEKLQYLIWEHETYREQTKEINKRLAMTLNEEGEQAMINQIGSIQEQVRAEWREKML